MIDRYVSIDPKLHLLFPVILRLNCHRLSSDSLLVLFGSFTESKGYICNEKSESSVYYFFSSTVGISSMIFSLSYGLLDISTFLLFPLQYIPIRY